MDRLRSSFPDASCTALTYQYCDLVRVQYHPAIDKDILRDHIEGVLKGPYAISILLCSPVAPTVLRPHACKERLRGEAWPPHYLAAEQARSPVEPPGKTYSLVSLG
jgi:hypothetical protein